eukprot:gene33678-41549_t
MGFSQTEPTTPIRQSDYLQSGGEEAEQRLARYQALLLRAQAVSAALPAASQDAYFQLVLYPLRASANLNARILKLDLAAQYARMGRPAARLYARQAEAAQAAIVADTARYNALGGGKWRGMMDAAPRRLPVFDAPAFPAYGHAGRSGCGVAYPAPLSAQGGALAFTRGRAETRTITLIQYGAQQQPWSAASVPDGMSLSASKGALNEANGYEQRIDVQYDGGASKTTALRFTCGDALLQAKLQWAPGAADGAATEHERIITLPATTGVATAGWSEIDLGSFGSSMRSDLRMDSRELGAATVGAGASKAAGAAAPALLYRFHSHTKGAAQLKIVAVPVHPLTSANRLRIAVSLDGQPPAALDFTTHGRSDEWKNNVLTNTAVRIIPLADLPPGPHMLQVHALDPGFILDRIEITFDGAPRYYGKPATADARLPRLRLAAALIAAGLILPAHAERQTYNFNPGWRLAVADPVDAAQQSFDDSAWKAVTLPRAWNEDDAFSKDIVDHSTGVAWYRKHFTLPATASGQKVFLEFEGARQAAEVYVNGKRIGLHENGINAFGFDITSALQAGGNVVAVRTDNSWDYREKATNQRYQWADKNFNANYGGLPKNVRLHVTDKLYQTLPLYSTLGTTGVYVYAREFDIPGRRATIAAESEVRNEYPEARSITYEVRVKDRDGKQVAQFASPPQTVAPGATAVVKASATVQGLNFWSW